MKKKNFKLKALGLAACLLTSAVVAVTPSSSAAEAANDATVQAYQAQLDDYEAKRQEAEQKAAAAQNNIDQAMDYKKALDDSISYTIQKINLAESMIDELEALIEETEAKMADRREAFLARVVTLHEDGNASYLELIMGSEDISMFLSRVDYVNSMMEYDHKVIADLQESKKIIEESQKTIEAAIQAQNETIAQLEADKAYYASAVKESDAVISIYENDKAAYQAEAQKYASMEESLNGELSAYLAQRQEETNKQYVGGTYMWPVPVQGTYISSYFGWRTLNGVQDYHAATDIPGATGTPIYASNAGEVLRSEWHDSYGNYVLIDHGNGESTLYAHMSARYVSAGQTVSQGDTIGAVGNTGFSFGAHLHFEFRVNGERVDPLGHVAAPY